MKLANETITVFNAKHDEESDAKLWNGTVIRGVSWYGSVADTITDKGLKAANRYTIRIPNDADTGGKGYVQPTIYREADDVSDLFTLGNGDVIVRGEAPTDGQTPALLRKTYEMTTILGVSDNRRAPNEPHLRITGA